MLCTRGCPKPCLNSYTTLPSFCQRNADKLCNSSICYAAVLCHKFKSTTTKNVCHVICRPRIRRVRQPGRPVLLGVLCCSLVRGRSWPVLLAHGCLLGRHHVCSCFVHRLLRAHIEIGARLLTWPVLLAHGCIVGRHHVCSCFVHRLLRAHIGIGARLLRAGQRGESVRLYGPKWLRCFDYCEREWLSFSTCFLSKSLVAELLSIRLCTQS